MKKNVTLAFTALLMVTANLKAQAPAATTTKLPFGQWLTKTPWTIGMGMNIIDDNQDAKTFESIRDSKWSPYKFTLDKALVKNFGVQLAFSSTSFLPHNFLAVDLNFKYNFIKGVKKFEPYALLGLGYAYRDYTEDTKNVVKKVDSKNTPGLNLGAGANLWIFPSVGLQGQAVANFGNDNFMGFALGMVFKIGTAAPKKCEVAPKTKEAEDALQHLRGIINK
jgi:hypothetical protein